MPSGVYFIQHCPTCARTLEVRVEYLGKRVTCQHCSAAFLASDDVSGANGTPSILERAEMLIHTVTSAPSKMAASNTAVPDGSAH